MKRSYQKKEKKELGQSLYEFAIVLPILIILIGFVVDIVRIVDTKLMIQSAAAESSLNIESRATMYHDVQDILENYYARIDSEMLDADLMATADQRHYYNFNSYSQNNSYVGTSQSFFSFFDATVDLKYELNMITPLAKLMLGDTFIVESKYTKMVYVGGFTW
ncbi:MAG: pilus assembly protein [Fusobacteria bacterium]|nr:pilus assembly protein [Fusobacteriota bacterium]